jgi:CspA family cold shock protein
MCRAGPLASITIEDVMDNGTVKFYNAQKGYGFIAPNNGSKDVFVHATALERAGISGLAEGQKVVFDTAEDRKTGKVSVQNIELA